MTNPSILKFSSWLSTVRAGLQRHFRLLEALGLVLALLAGYLEVASIRTHDRLRLDFTIETSTESMAFYIMKRLIAMHELQALNAVYPDSKSGLPRTIHLDPLEQSRWQNILFQALFNFALQFRIFEQRAYRIQRFRLEAGLSPLQSLDNLAKALAGERESIETMMRVIGRPVTANAKPQKGPDMPLIQNTLNSYIVSIATTEEQSLRESSARRTRQSRLYLSLFVIGSILLVAGKLGDWLRDSQSRAA